MRRSAHQRTWANVWFRTATVQAVTAPQPPTGGQFYDEVGVSESYLRHRHSLVDSPNVAMEEPAFLSEMGDIENQRILDLGCGDADFAHAVIDRRGHSYVGVDGSAAMIGEARLRIEHPKVSLIHEGIENYVGEPESFDLVASRMSLHYIDDLDAVLGNVRLALRPGGRLIFTVVHPVITSPIKPKEGRRTDYTVDRYFERGQRVRQWFGSTVTWQHRTIEDYVSVVQRCGLDFVSLRECEPDPAFFADRPDELKRRRRVPLMLLVSARRPSGE